MSDKILQSYKSASEQYAELNINTDQVIEKLKNFSISLHCWQGDDVGGFESGDQELSGGIAVTGNYPGKARNIDELRADLEKVYSILPGKHRLNLHAIYGDFGGKSVERNEISTQHFDSWIEWAKDKIEGIDFNPTCFSHPNSDDGFTISHHDNTIREFWIEHCINSRKIAAHIGNELNSPSVNNIWIPDGYKDIPYDKTAPRLRLKESLDKILAADVDTKNCIDAVESKLFGIGSESYVVGSHEFYLGYAVAKQVALCLDAGHFHPTETIDGKFSAIMPFISHLLLHVSRPVRWDSDHVVILNDELQSIAQELIRGNYQNKTSIGLDFFDASINRIAAWAVGTRSMIKALLIALLEPQELLKQKELEGDYTSRMILFEQLKCMPFGAIWDYYCKQNNVPTDDQLIASVKEYEKTVLSAR